MFAPFDMGTPPFVLGPYLLWPERLEVAIRNDGRPDLSLDLVRGTDPSRPPRPYARLDYRLTVGSRFEATLLALRALEPQAGATLALARPRGGFLRITPLAGSTELPVELQAPAALAWDGLDCARVWQRLSLDDGIVVRDALLAGTLLVRADVQLELDGVSPRVAARAVLDPRELLTALHQRADHDGVIEREQVVAHFLTVADRLVTAALGPLPDPVLLAEILTDRVRVRFGTAVMGAPGRAAMRLPSPESIGGGRFEWDLSQPFVAPRPAFLSLDPFEAARQVIATHGAEAVVRSTVVPSFESGVLPVTVDVNLPVRPEGLLGLGVNLDAPPAPPRRVQAAIATVELSPDRPTATAVLKLAPGEDPAYSYEVFAIVRGHGGIDRVVGPRIDHRGDALYLSPATLPVRFVPISADAGLLEQGDLDVCLRWSLDGEAFEHRAVVTPGTPAMSLVLAERVEQAELELALVERGGSGRQALPRLPAAGVCLGLHSFAEHGPRDVRLEAALDADDLPILVDVRPEAAADAVGDHDPATITVLLSPEQPERTVTYHSTSIFRPGYRWRWRATGGGAFESPWSAVSRASHSIVGPPSEHAMSRDTVTLAESTAERDPSAPARFSYWPSRPRPELAPNGQPTLMLIAGSVRGTVQLGLRWFVSDEDVELLRRHLVESRTDLDLAALELVEAPVANVEASVIVRTDDGAETELARRPASGAPPQSAIFSLSLDETALALVRRALTGERGCFIARYHVTLLQSIRTEATSPGVTVVSEELVPRTITVEGDIGEWFGDGRAANVVELPAGVNP